MRRKLLGYQIADDEGNNLAGDFLYAAHEFDVSLRVRGLIEQPSYRILSMEEANAILEEVQPRFKWLLMPIYEGDIEEPVLPA